MIQLLRQRNAPVWLRSARAGFLVWVFVCLQTLAASPALHHELHDDSDHPDHTCGVTLLQHGQVASPLPSPVIFAPTFTTAPQPVRSSLTRARQFVVMAGDGRCFPVKEVLASSATNDVVLLRLDLGGARLTPLPLEDRAPVGSRVFVLGHPESHYYTFTEGIVARYFTGQEETGAAEMMSITAEFAPGSSGCPILNERGNVVGMADNIVRAGYDSKKAQGASIVFKHCRPASAIRALVLPTKP